MLVDWLVQTHKRRNLEVRLKLEQESLLMHRLPWGGSSRSNAQQHSWTRRARWSCLVDYLLRRRNW